MLKEGAYKIFGRVEEVRGPYWTLTLEITQPYLQSRTQKHQCCKQYTHLEELSWGRHSDIRKASLPCLMQVSPTGKTCNALRPLPAREPSKWRVCFILFCFAFQFLEYRGKCRKRGRDVKCQSTIVDTNFPFLGIFCVAAILPIFHSLFKSDSVFLAC